MVIATAILWAAFGAASAQDADLEKERRRLEIDTMAQSTIESLLSRNEGAKGLYDRAAGYAVFSATKAGFLVTGGGGRGVAINKATGERAYMRMGTGGIGLGIGAQTYQLVILFETPAVLEQFMDGGWDSSATAQAAAGQEGVTVTSSFIDGMAFYQITDKGLMAVADVAGTRFWVADALN
jgi:lipid-binding SYLF domain-containing protein